MFSTTSVLWMHFTDKVREWTKSHTPIDMSSDKTHLEEVSNEPYEDMFLIKKKFFFCFVFSFPKAIFLVWTILYLIYRTFYFISNVTHCTNDTVLTEKFSKYLAELISLTLRYLVLWLKFGDHGYERQVLKPFMYWNSHCLTLGGFAPIIEFKNFKSFTKLPSFTLQRWNFLV